MNIIEQIRLMEKLSPPADEIIIAYNEGKESFEPANKNMFEQYSDTILEIVGGAGIKAKYENGKVFVEFN
ncbi:MULTISPECIES: hypothetical protein [unclassified Clostridium]|uniref:hypothetical protein n=1 Tax=unclassified Clostridium TaxID=2614128 RepID=UPI0025C61E42|nr:MULTISPECIES: hypothetical protein [unclassified Clostridium]